MHKAIRDSLRLTLLVLIVPGVVYAAVMAAIPKTAPAFVPVPTYTNTPVPTATATPRPTPTVDVEAVYLRQMEAWYRDVAAWIDDWTTLNAVPVAERDAAWDALDRRGVDLVAQVRDFSPPLWYIEANLLATTSAQHCLDGLRYIRAGNPELAHIYADTCVDGLAAMLKVLFDD